MTVALVAANALIFAALAVACGCRLHYIQVPETAPASVAAGYVGIAMAACIAAGSPPHSLLQPALGGLMLYQIIADRRHGGSGIDAVRRWLRCRR